MSAAGYWRCLDLAADAVVLDGYGPRVFDLLPADSDDVVLFEDLRAIVAMRRQTDERGCENRRAAAAAAAAFEPETEVECTQRSLARWREGDDLARPREMLARLRGDRRTVAEISIEFGMHEATARENIERALRAAGDRRTVAELERIPLVPNALLRRMGG